MTSEGYPATNAFYSAHDFQKTSPMNQTGSVATPAANPYSNVVKPLQTNALLPALQTGSVRNPAKQGVSLTYTEPVKQVQPKSAHVKTEAFPQAVEKALEEQQDHRTLLVP